MRDWWRKRRADRERAAAQERERAAAHERERAALQHRCARLVGDAVTSVVYVEMYDEPEWNLVDDYDSVAHAVELTLRSRRTVALQWDDPVDSDFGFSFQMRMVEGVSTVTDGPPRHDVSATSRWSSLIGRTITGCRVIWKPVGRRTETAQTIRLDFETDRRVLVTAAEFDGDNGHWGADHVTVFFDDAWERRSDLTHDIHETLD